MQIQTIVMLKTFIIFLTGIIMFVGCQTLPATRTGEVSSLGEATLLFLLYSSMKLALWSEYTYETILDEGVNMSYRFYQKLGLIVSFLFLLFFANVYIFGYGVTPYTPK
jgi:hypothetical protein